LQCSLYVLALSFFCSYSFRCVKHNCRALLLVGRGAHTDIYGSVTVRLRYLICFTASHLPVLAIAETKTKRGQGESVLYSKSGAWLTLHLYIGQMRSWE